jgi:beta-phosphoglucomutase family hydrolase
LAAVEENAVASLGSRPTLRLVSDSLRAFDAAIFDMDGVVTQTSRLHAAAWKELFDDALHRLAPAGAAIHPFDERQDFRQYVDGRPRLEGVRSFLDARGLQLPEGGEDDPPEALTVHGLARRKEMAFERRLAETGVEVFPSTVALIEALRTRGVRVGVATSSRHGRQILGMTGLDHLFDARMDGIDQGERGLAGKPNPDLFLACADLLATPPERAVVFEDAPAGVMAGRRGGFGLVVGVDRGGSAESLARAGAEVVVRDLVELDADRLEATFRARLHEMAWQVEAEGFDTAREHAMESLFGVGNGYFGVRGALDTPLPGSQSDLFVAGIYDAKNVELAYSELELMAPSRGGNPYAQLEPLPSPFRITVRVEGEPLDFSGPTGRSLKRRLEMRDGLSELESAYETSGGHWTTVRTQRCASLADPHLALHEVVVTPEHHSGAISLSATLADPADIQRQWRPPMSPIEHQVPGDGDRELVRYVTRASGLEVCIVARTVHDAATQPVARASGEPTVLRRVLSIFTSRDGPDPRAAALAHNQALDATPFDALVAAHAARWHEFWESADVRIPGRPATEQALRFAAYHLRSAAGDDPRVSIPARGLNGRAYEGHVFWDTEIFMMPFYLHVAPAEARNILRYRHNTLGGARRRARELGYGGACFAWESTITGDDVTPTQIVMRSSGQAIPIFTGMQQVHVTADIAYAVCRYWEATHDDAFLASAGADLLFETARFWTTRVSEGPQHHHIRGVVGPDEYHFGVNDNAYTNWMARFNLERAAWTADRLGRAVGDRLLDGEEPQRWRALAASLFCPAPDRNGVIEQFEGFFDLGEHSLSHEERFRAPVSRLFDWERVNRLKIVKQADVLMLPLLFPDAFTDEVVAANYRYYEPLTDHGSSLSPPVHAAIAARLGLREDAERYWRQSLWLDLSDAMDNSSLGVHPAAMGGTWQAMVFGFLGVRFGDDGPVSHARALEGLTAHDGEVTLRLSWRSRSWPVAVTLAPPMQSDRGPR